MLARRSLLLLLLLFLAPLICTGCGDSGDYVLSSAPPAPAPTTSTLQSLTVSPSSQTIAKGTSAEFTAMGTFSDGTTQNLSSAASWSSSSTRVASVSQGHAVGLQVGTTTLTASFGNLSSSARLTVSEATVVAITLSPSRPTIAKGTSQVFTVEGFFSDASFQDVTSDVTFSSSNTTVSTLVGGLATAKEPGQTTITASLGNVTTETILSVTPATLQRVSLSGPSSIGQGTIASFTVIGDFSDGSTQDLSGQAQWSVNPGGFATVDRGRLTGLSSGTVTLTAAFAGISSSTEVTINPAFITTIEVKSVPTGAAARVVLRRLLELRAVATLSDGTQQDVTIQANWTTDPAAATVVAGLFRGIAVGATKVTASFGGVSGQLEVEVLPIPGVHLVLQAGQTYSLNTTSGVLLPAIGGSDIVPGWNASDQRLHLATLTVEDGAVLNVTGDVAFKVVAEGDVAIAGIVDFSGRDGVKGIDGRVATDGENGQKGGDIEIASTSAISLSGFVISNGGNGGAGGGFTVAGDNTSDISTGDGGKGGPPGQISLNAPGLVGNSRVTAEGGDGGAGGDVTIAASNRATLTHTLVMAGNGGDGAENGRGGRGGNVSLASRNRAEGDDLHAEVRAGMGGNGGGNAPGGSGGSVVMASENSTNSDYTRSKAIATAGAGGSGGVGALGGPGGDVIFGTNQAYGPGNHCAATAGAGGPGGAGAAGGAGGNVRCGSTNFAFGGGYAEITAGAGGKGGAGAAGGAGGSAEVRSYNSASGDGNRAEVKGGAGGDGGELGAGGDGGAAFVLSFNDQYGNSVALVQGGNGGNGFGGAPGGAGGAATFALSNSGTVQPGARGTP